MAAQIKLAHTLDLTVEDPAAITALLEREVHRLIRKARRQRTSESTPKLPLIRLQVNQAAVQHVIVPMIVPCVPAHSMLQFAQ